MSLYGFTANKFPDTEKPTQSEWAFLLWGMDGNLS